MFGYNICMTDVRGHNRCIFKCKTYDFAVRKVRYFEWMHPKRKYWIEMVVL